MSRRGNREKFSQALDYCQYGKMQEGQYASDVCLRFTAVDWISDDSFLSPNVEFYHGFSGK
jgi:hypothetical protein